ncbi:two-component system response regulator [Cystobacter fuscus]|uniref:Two-component system response regulator n=1 Tax=Cystobacter fuscus TaxID=43 RepID=A0A250IWQ3_9BACT|nr:response regulator [Cystobacter fuscus]ATB35326.1 two-component system response regulator [Cystobacter fuscus]
MSTLKRILLVEDSDNDVQLTLAALEETHLANEVDVVKDGQQALDYLFRRGPFVARGEEHPAVVLLDLKLPKLNGLEVLARLKGDSELKTIPVVMLTSSREEPDLKRAYGLGVNAYVVKPVGFNAFTSALKELGLFWAILNEPPPGTVRKDSR